jgi:hypothetical protein
MARGQRWYGRCGFRRADLDLSDTTEKVGDERTVERPVKQVVSHAGVGSDLVEIVRVELGFGTV